MDPQLLEDYRGAIERGMADGSLMPREQIERHLESFKDRFSPAKIAALDGAVLLDTLHGRNVEAKCLMYWLEFKDDDEFRGNRLGSIAGGSALKFGIFQRAADGAWISGSPLHQRVISVEEAINEARKQRDELLAGVKMLDSLDPNDTSDENYARLQISMQSAAPHLSQSIWSRKYWFLTFPDRLDAFHSWKHQAFYVYKFLAMPPEIPVAVQGQEPRFLFCGRFLGAAKDLKVPVMTLNQMMVFRHGPPRPYWKVGTTVGAGGKSHWEIMKTGSFVSIGWKESIPDLAKFLSQDKSVLKNQIREWLAPTYANSSTASRKAGEIVDFAREIAEGDLVLACDGANVLGIGKVNGQYQYDEGLEFPHKLPVEWLSFDHWQMPEIEGPQTTVFPFGKKSSNRLELERRLFRLPSDVPVATRGSENPQEVAPLPTLDSFTARVSALLSRKGQVILYGPPGTGKTYRALLAAKELAARTTFKKNFEQLTASERETIVDSPHALVRICTFHPGWGYEDFIEGLRPVSNNGQLVFEARDGIFKRICTDAASDTQRNYFLIIDEVNRGDIPRVFGELLTLLERDKRGQRVFLPMSGSQFTIPPNVLIVGTMNTADRSISLLDTALRRRFGFIELMPDSTLLKGRVVGTIPLGPWLDALNQRLRQNLKRDARNLQVGHSYLMSIQSGQSLVEFGRVVRDEIIPLLEEYCYDDFETLKSILGEGLVDVPRGEIKSGIFDPSHENDLLEALSFEEVQAIAITRSEDQVAIASEDSAITADDDTLHASS